MLTNYIYIWSKVELLKLLIYLYIIFHPGNDLIDIPSRELINEAIDWNVEIVFDFVLREFTLQFSIFNLAEGWIDYADCYIYISQLIDTRKLASHFVYRISNIKSDQSTK